MNLVGRKAEQEKLRLCLKAGQHVLLEGPVGVGKTHLASFICQGLGKPLFRVDGDSRFSEQKLVGWFDPPQVISRGYTEDAFIFGPLVEAMKSGGVLFINELNRLPEGVQNVLLPALDEGLVQIPRLGEIRAARGFVVIATQNPKEFVATSHLSEALLDRFSLIKLDYPTRDEEIEIVRSQTNVDAKTAEYCVDLVRLTREDSRLRRGASIRAALSVAELMKESYELKKDYTEALRESALLGLATRVEMEVEISMPGSPNVQFEDLVNEWVQLVTQGIKTLKKKT